MKHHIQVVSQAYFKNNYAYIAKLYPRNNQLIIQSGESVSVLIDVPEYNATDDPFENNNIIEFLEMLRFIFASYTKCVIFITYTDKMFFLYNTVEYAKGVINSSAKDIPLIIFELDNKGEVIAVHIRPVGRTHLPKRY